MDLLATILELRQKQFTHLPEDLVAEIVRIEIDYAEDRSEAQKRVEQALEKYLNNLPELASC
jgi:hypothetical protein